MAKKKKDGEEPEEEIKKDDFFDSAVFKKYKKEFGDEFAVPLSEIKDEEKGVVKTFPSLDIALNGGLARGQLVQIAGRPKTGKTTTALGIAANFQMQYPDKKVFYYKVEGRLSSDLARNIPNLDLNNLIVVKSTKKKILSGVDHLSMVEDNMRNYPDSLHILDSVGGITGEQELSGSMGDQQRGELGKLLAKFCRRNSGVIDVTNSLIIALNHVRDKMDASGRGGTYSPGGKHWQHQLDTDIMLSIAFPNGKITTPDGVQIGHNIAVKIKTTTMAAPDQEVVLPLIYGKGVCFKRDIFNMAESFGVIEKAASWYSFEDNKWQGANSVLEAIYNDDELFEKIKSRVLEIIENV